MEKQYSIKKTAAKAAPPFVLLALVHSLKAALKTKNIELPDDLTYSAALSLYGGYSGLVNWIKNRKKTVKAKDQDKTKEKKPDAML